MSGNNGFRFSGDAFVLFHFDALQTYLRGDLEFRNSAGETLRLPEAMDPEALHLGYRAMCQVGGGRLPSVLEWQEHVAVMSKALHQSAAVFDMDVFAVRAVDPGLPPVWAQEYWWGPEQIMLLYDLVLSEPTSTMNGGRWSTLALLWLDHVLYFLLTGDAAAAVSCAVRATDAVNRAEPALTRSQALSEFGRANALKKLASDPKQLEKLRVKSLWLQLRHEPKFRGKKAPLARHIMEQVTAFDNEKVLTDWFREWEKEPASNLPGKVPVS